MEPLLLLIAATVLMAAITAGEGALYRSARGEPISWTPLVGLRLLDWSTCAVFVPPLYAALRRLPHDGRFLRVTVPALLGASVLAAVLKYVVHTPLAALANPAGARTIAEAISSDLLSKVTFYWGVIGILYAVALYRGDLTVPGSPSSSPHDPLKAADWLVLRESGGTSLLKTDEIVWIEAEGNYCRIHGAGRPQLVRRTLSSLLDELKPAGFVRVHRSKVVNAGRVRRLQSDRGALSVVLAEGSIITVGRAYRAEVRRLFCRSSSQDGR